MSDLLKNIIRFALFIGVQVFILNRIPPLHRFITPYLYFLFLLWMPFKTPRLGLTLLGFLFGLTLDFFTKTPGLHAAACTLVAYLRPFLIRPDDAQGKNGNQLCRTFCDQHGMDALCDLCFDYDLSPSWLPCFPGMDADW